MFGALLLFENDFIHIVSIAFTALILTELFMVALTVRTWHYLMIVGELLSLLLYVASLFIFHSYFGECRTVAIVPAASCQWILTL